jgi:tetraacyldisaccharide 4'-kinase
MLKAPAFWWRPRGLLALSLAPLALLYGWAAAARMKRVGKKIKVPVICIGNVVAGGAGKTPTAIALAKALQMSGKSPVFLTRGYGGKSVGPMLVDLARHTSRDGGDEAVLLAKIAPTIIAQDRLAGAHLAEKYGDIVIMDDGFQNPALYKDCSIIVVDTGQGIGNGLCLPAGPLRAPLKTQWAKADLCVLIGDDRDDRYAFSNPIPIPIYRGRLMPQASQANALKALNVFAFAGIGRPDKFFDTLAKVGAVIVEKRYFSDHYRYTVEDIDLIISQASEKFLIPVTTAKDAVKIAEIAPDALNTIRVLEVTLQMENMDGWINAILNKLPLKN